MSIDITSGLSNGSNHEDDVDLPDAPQPEKVALENIFDDENEDDEEFPSSTAIPSSPPIDDHAEDHNSTHQSQTSSNNTHPPTPSSPSSSPTNEPASSIPPITIPTTTTETESYSDPTITAQYYTRLFPFRPLYLWLNHSLAPNSSFTNREFAFTLSNDAYLRYQSFPTSDLLRKEVLRLNPSRFEIGPEYSCNPRDRKTLRKSTAFRPVGKELVFDIDLTDYDDIRTCCTKAEICTKCWRFATLAIKVIDAGLREDFGFEWILWVYSGRRGVHAWISDPVARGMDDDVRKAVVGYFEIVKGGAGGSKKVTGLRRPLHPHVRRSLAILGDEFGDVLEDQENFVEEKGWERLLKLLSEGMNGPGQDRAKTKELEDALRRKWSSAPGRPSRRKWEDIREVARTVASGKDFEVKRFMEHVVEAQQEIMLEYSYPRIDVEVGKKKIHLLKSPWVVHPGTGRVCVPITCGGDMKRADGFDPLSVPKVTELLREIDAWGQENAGVNSSMDVDSSASHGTAGTGGNGIVKKMPDWEKTSLKPYMELFNRYVAGLMKSQGQTLKREREEDGHTGANGMEF